MRYVKLLRPLYIGTRNHLKGDIVLVSDEKGADLIVEGLALAYSGTPPAIANPDVNRLQEAIDPEPSPTYAPISEDGLTAHNVRAVAPRVADNPGLVTLRKAAELSPEHKGTGEKLDKPEPAEVPNTAATTPTTTRLTDPPASGNARGRRSSKGNNSPEGTPPPFEPPPASGEAGSPDASADKGPGHPATDEAS